MAVAASHDPERFECDHEAALEEQAAEIVRLRDRLSVIYTLSSSSLGLPTYE